MDEQPPWWRTLFEHDYYDRFDPNGPRSPLTPEQREQRTGGQVEFLAGLLGEPPLDLLDLCCGHGRHAVPLALRGCRVTGLDLSPYHIELARQAAGAAGVEADWIEGDMREIPRPDASFDAVLNLFTAFGYFEEAAENQRVLDEVARVLRPGGRLVLDHQNRDSLMRRFQEHDWYTAGDGSLVIEERWFDSASGRTGSKWTAIEQDGTRVEYSFSVRSYTLQELALLLERSGLHVLEAYGDFEGAAFTRFSPRMIVVAGKP